MKFAGFDVTAFYARTGDNDLFVPWGDGKVLIHCFGGCETIDVLQAVGLNWSDIQPPRQWPE